MSSAAQVGGEHGIAWSAALDRPVLKANFHLAP
jgi:hypothetical protein